MHIYRVLLATNSFLNIEYVKKKYLIQNKNWEI